MSGYAQQVPVGWTRGERLLAFRNGSLVCLRQHPDNPLDFHTKVTADTVFSISFDTEAEMREWLTWWKAK